jgi:hypothetical protein
METPPVARRYVQSLHHAGVLEEHTFSAKPSISQPDSPRPPSFSPASLQNTADCGTASDATRNFIAQYHSTNNYSPYSMENTRHRYPQCRQRQGVMS